MQSAYVHVTISYISSPHLNIKRFYCLFDDSIDGHSSILITWSIANFSHFNNPNENWMNLVVNRMEMHFVQCLRLMFVSFTVFADIEIYIQRLWADSHPCTCASVVGDRQWHEICKQTEVCWSCTRLCLSVSFHAPRWTKIVELFHIPMTHFSLNRE